ncbi:FAD-binding oxidoreductase [Bacillus luteolus]|uniref:FAD-binding oxidoreductase n=1 Tax=Litchfieldia luteola TaxID=682179 RepID=A0ABR9QIQ1_9BACI|nr:FAD-binding oxidoreductase [Cytobacillus luteolus]MBE4908378.1 FAD-binding oxidoreductase [Cytobacillus luteolus]MBP1943166.1 FAD/FMN-containing dehydrogenase [Cytobacillus luteolus]
MKRLVILFICIITYLSFFFLSTINNKEIDNNLVVSDVSGLMPVKVKKIVQKTKTEELVEIIEEAKEKDLKISIAGTRHSMGGHTYYKDAIVLDMTNYNQILDFNPIEKTITVQSGATWNDIQNYINPQGLAVKVMQSQNIFTIGGSLSANAHGRDIRYGSLIDTVKSFRLLTAEGKIINVSRKENSELFALVIGGYGLFGVILDVELELTDDELYEMNTVSMDYKEYAAYFTKDVKGDPSVRMHLARISTAPENFLTDMYVTNYVLSKEELKEHTQLKKDRFTWLTKFTLGLSRQYDWGKDWFWTLQQSYFHNTNGSLISRNNVMRSESKFLEYENSNDTDVLQEYFVPIDLFPRYIDELRTVLSNEDLNLINITIRYVSKDEDAVLSYAKDNMFALVLLINQGFSESDQQKTKEIVQKMIDVTLSHNGSYYLPYMPYPTKEQMLRSYPRAEEFFQRKLIYDPEERFMNFFYERYK